VVAQRSLEIATGGERAHIHSQSPKRRVRGHSELKPRAPRWNTISPDPSRGVGHRRGWRSVAPAITVVIVSEFINIGIIIGGIEDSEITDQRGYSGFPIQAALSVKPPVHPIDRSFDGQVDVGTLRNRG